MIAALYVQTGGCYFGLDGVEPWDEQRDARRYDGPHPAISHTPCQRWGKMWWDGIADALKVNDRRFLPQYHFAEPVKNARVVICIGDV